MKIVVLMKQVANKDAVLRIGKDEKWIDESDVAFQTNESDGYALEEALRLKEAKGGGEVVVCTLGNQGARAVIKDALARGADRAIHIVVDSSQGLSPFTIAQCIADAVKEENADLVFSGLQSDDSGYGQTGVILAELLGIPHATLVIEVDRDNAEFRVKRELESGWYQWFTYKLPALMTIQSGISQIRYASLKGIMAAKSKPVKEITPSAEALSYAAKQVIQKVYMPLKLKQTQMLGGGDAKKGAAELVEKLKTEVRVL
jgi:electron transfer flavoprotein beta subunit